MEIRDLYDKDRNKLNKTIIKGETPQKGEYYQVIFVVIKDTKENKFLIQKRSIDKGGKWSCTAGHPKSGETSYDGLLTETKEELGLDLSKEKVILYDTILDDFHIFDYYYTEIELDVNSLIIQEEEVTDIKLVTLDKLEQLIDNGEFEENHGLCMKNFIYNYPNIKNKYDNSRA